MHPEGSGQSNYDCTRYFLKAHVCNCTSQIKTFVQMARKSI